MSYVYNVTKDDVVNELKRLSSEGSTMKSSEFENWLYRGIRNHFGGWKKCREELGIITESKKGTGRKSQWNDDSIRSNLIKAHEQTLSSTDLYEKYPSLINAISHRYGGLKRACQELDVPSFSKRKRATKYQSKTDMDIVNEIKQVYSKYSAPSERFLSKKGYGRLVEQARKRFGSWNDALIKCGFEPKMPRFDSKEEVASKYKQDFDRGLTRKDITYRKAVNRYFGSLEALEKYLGIYENPHIFFLYDKANLDSLIYKIYENEEDRINAKLLDSIDKNIVYSIRTHYKSITEYFSQLDLDFYRKPYVPFKWDAENTKRQLMRWIREGKPVNYTYVARKHGGIIEASRKFYGNYEGLFEACGYSYDDFRTDTTLASFFGRELEDVFESILIDLKQDYVRQPSVNGCHPDFVVGDTWYDAKLSEWTISLADCGTVKKYEPHCKELVIVFLRGNTDLNKSLSEKTKLINIYHYVNMLPKEKQNQYKTKLDEILMKVEPAHINKVV